MIERAKLCKQSGDGLFVREINCVAIHSPTIVLVAS
jgi:hypothetical protein